MKIVYLLPLILLNLLLRMADSQCSKNCHSCDQDEGECSLCEEGFNLNMNNQCVKCPSSCSACKQGTQGQIVCQNPENQQIKRRLLQKQPKRMKNLKFPFYLSIKKNMLCLISETNLQYKNQNWQFDFNKNGNTRIINGQNIPKKCITITNQKNLYYIDCQDGNQEQIFITEMNSNRTAAKFYRVAGNEKLYLTLVQKKQCTFVYDLIVTTQGIENSINGESFSQYWTLENV